MTDVTPPFGGDPAVAPRQVGLDRSILVHAPQSNVGRVAEFCRNQGSSVVYTVTRGNRTKTAGQLLKAHQKIAGEGSQVLFDANRYSGRNRADGDSPPSLDWVLWQRDNGAPIALTDPGYIGPGRMDHVAMALGRAADIANVVTGAVMAMLPIDYLILKENAESLREQIERAGVPVALAIGHTGDPFGAAETVRGLLHTLGSSVEVALVRADLSAVGAVACGAKFGAVGTSASLRHIWPPQSGGKPSAGVSVLVPRLMSYHLLERLPLVAAQLPADHFWCDCAICLGGPVFDQVTAETAFAHSIGSIAAFSSSLVSEGNPDSRGSFRRKAMTAQSLHLEIADAMDDKGWSPPSSLNAWVKALADR